jgi:cell filamentation protein, protein adenylyltransferase
MTRYSTHGTEGQYQPGSNETVLLNMRGITDAGEMDDTELELLDQLYDKVLDEVEVDQCITVTDLKEWHRSWLGNIYDWAGDERSVNMGKGDFQFAAARQIPALLAKFESDYLSCYTPCDGFDEEELVEAIAEVHVELILIHPFREGNGRLSRLLANIMALQAGWPELDFSLLDTNKDYYFKSIQAGVTGNFEPLKRLMRDTLNLADEE